MKRLSIFWILLALPCVCFAQGAHRIGQVLVRGNNVSANVAPFASILVCQHGTNCTAVPVYTDPALSHILPQPITANASGTYDYYVALGCYDERISSPGQGAIVNANVCPNNGTSGGGIGYPIGTGIPQVSSSTSWATTLTAPAGAIVGTTDTQTLTNKTVDGVSPTVFGFLDPTSSVQTQLNGKQNSITITTTGSSGAATLIGGTLNIPQYTGGGGGTFPAGTGIAVVSSGTAWGTTLAAPTGAIVGISDTQTLTNKTYSAPTMTGTITLPFTGVVQCLHVNTAGGLSGTGSDCGSGGGGGTPGGSSGQLQYNNSGVFGGISNVTTSAGAITGMSISGTSGAVLASGVIDGVSATFTTTATTVSVAPNATGSLCDDGTNARGCLGAYYYNNVTGGSAAVTYTLRNDSPVGAQYCFENAISVTSSLILQTGGAGQFIAYQGVNSASNGNVTLASAIGNAACVKRQSSSQWYLVLQTGTATVN